MSTTEIQNRRVMSTSSGLGPVSAVTITGSRVIPQIGHTPGPGRRISGCIGHVYSTASTVSSVEADRSAVELLVPVTPPWILLGFYRIKRLVEVRVWEQRDGDRVSVLACSCDGVPG